MPFAQRSIALTAICVAALLAACRQQSPSVPPTPEASNVSSPSSAVVPSSDLRGASDHANAPPAVGAMTADQASSGGARGGAMPPTGGDGSSAGSSPSRGR